jgi:hypothetical protein
VIVEKRHQVLPGLLFGKVEVTGEGGSTVVFDLGRHQEAVGLADLPVVVEEALSAGAFTAETPEAYVLVLVADLDAVVLVDGVAVVLFSGVPDREERDLLAVSQLLQAQITLGKSGGHEVGAGG